MKVSYVSLGCKVNLYESIAIVNEFVRNGFELVNFDQKSDVYIINTCTVTQTSDAKSRKMIRQAVKHNNQAIVCVMGCFSQLNSLEVSKIPGVSIICGTSNRKMIYPKVMELLKTKNKELINLTQTYQNINEYEDICLDHYDHKTRGFVKIQDGCENFCSYCAIPYSRGRFRSRDEKSIIEEINKLTKNGMKEIVLSGINTGAYGKELDSLNFPKLLDKIIKEIPDVGRIRISSIEATEITEELLNVMKKNINHFCMHLHIPLQGGSDEILKKMNRKYDTEYYRQKLKNIRDYFPDINITADIMAGFNGETDELFNKAYDFIKEMNYGEIHVFPYSPRPNTVAFLESKKIKFTDRVDNIKLKYRVNELLQLNEIKALEYRCRFENKEVEVLVERVDEIDGNLWAFGHTSNYLEVRFKTKSAKNNDLVNVKLVKANYPISEGEEINVFKI